MAAFKTVVKGGLIPHAKQAGKFVDGVAVPGSKVVGTGFEKEHIGQIQVALTGFGFGFGFGLGLVVGVGVG